MIEHPFKQGTPEWYEARRGVITASRAKGLRRTDGLTIQQRTYVQALQSGQSESAAREAAGYKAAPKADIVSQAIAGTLALQFGDGAHTYAKEVARERCGGREPEGFQVLAQRTGHEEEQFAAIEYVAKTGRDIEEAFFITTDDRKYGMSLDRWVAGRRSALEIKTMVSASTLFNAMVDGDISDYRDQCLFGLWLFTLDWIDLCLWCPDLQALHIERIERDEDQIQALEDDLIAFDVLVSAYEKKLRARISTTAEAPSAPPWETAMQPRAVAPIAPASKTTALIANPFA